MQTTSLSLHGMALLLLLLLQALTRTASGCLSGFSCMELGLLIAALADLHWRPTDAWMTVSGNHREVHSRPATQPI